MIHSTPETDCIEVVYQEASGDLFAGFGIHEQLMRGGAHLAFSPPDSRLRFPSTRCHSGNSLPALSGSYRNGSLEMVESDRRVYFVRARLLLNLGPFC